MTLPRLAYGSAVLAVAALATLGACSGSPSVAAAYDTVQRGTISVGVSASGALASSSTEQLGFPQGGKLTHVLVKVGQKVIKGQTLARIDSRVAQHTLEAAEANLDAQNAGLGRTTDSTAVAASESALSQARHILAATKHQRTAIRKADSTAISRAKKQLRTDRDAKDQAEDAATAVRKACSASTRGNAAQLSALAEQANQQLQAGDNAAATTTLAQLSTLINAGGATTGSPCDQVVTVQAAVSAAGQRVTADETAVVLAERKLEVDTAGADLSVQTTTQGVVSAQSAYNAAAADRPHSVDQQQALVAAAQAQVENAQKAVDDTVLTAPVDGTVAALNGAVGEYLTPSTGTSALAPGSRAAIPGASGAGSSSATGGASPTRPGGTQFIVLTGVSQLQLVLPFEESDAASIRAGQQVQVLLDALPGATVQGTVVSVAPSATPIAGVINFYATVRIDGADARMRDGQTARATVVVAEHAGVLTVANSALATNGTATTVTVLDAAGQQKITTVQTGIRGTDRTEITGGLSEGQRVVVAGHP